MSVRRRLTWLSAVCVVIVIMPMVFVLRLLRRFVRAVHNCLPYSRFSPHTRRRRSLRGRRLDPDATAHYQPCVRCGLQAVVPLTACRLERGPWRLVWLCRSCGEPTAAIVRLDLVPWLLDLEVAGGLMLSLRELELWARADEDDLSEAFADELL